MSDQATTYRLSTTVDLEADWQRGNLPELLRQLADEIERDPGMTLWLRLDQQAGAEWMYAERWRVRRRVRRYDEIPDPDPAQQAASAERDRREHLAAGRCPECRGERQVTDNADRWRYVPCTACKATGAYPTPAGAVMPAESEWEGCPF